ncbi:MAG TPA: peroxiredoxin-like family protein [Methylomirabilota bacterium]|nr:peroxiredoxin-like family protein [Methylomirabilota bacterium]
MAGLKATLPEIRARGGEVVVVGCGQPEHIAGFRDATGYDGPLLTDPSLRTFRAADLGYGWTRTYHPLTLLKGLRAFAGGFRQGARRGNAIQQGGTFVLGPGERVRFEWRDRFAGDHPPMVDVLGALAS